MKKPIGYLCMALLGLGNLQAAAVWDEDEDDEIEEVVVVAERIADPFSGYPFIFYAPMINMPGQIGGTFMVLTEDDRLITSDQLAVEMTCEEAKDHAIARGAVVAASALLGLSCAALPLGPKATCLVAVAVAIDACLRGD